MQEWFYWLLNLLSSETKGLQKENTNNELMTKKILDSMAVNHIEKIYRNIMEMVRFAEAKNGVLLTVNIAIFIEIAKYGLPFDSTFQKICGIIIWCALLCSISILLVSFLPKLHTNNKSNPLYFGSITTFCEDDYKNRMQNSSSSDLHAYYCQQIHINSAIAKRKFIQFKLALLFSIISLLTFGLVKVLLNLL